MIRFNAGPTEGFEQYVGFKTTLRILNSPDHQGPPGDELRVTTLRNSDVKEWVKIVGGGGDREATSRALAMDPEFLCHAWTWIHRRGDKPSSGLVGVVMALKMCREVHLYGFQSSNYFSKTSRVRCISVDSTHGGVNSRPMCLHR